MPVEYDLREMMPHSVTIEPYSGQDAYAEPSYGAGVAYVCRVIGRPRMVRDSDGQERVSNGTIYLDRAVSISPRDRITLPDGAKPKILAIYTRPDSGGNYYSEVLV